MDGQERTGFLAMVSALGVRMRSRSARFLRVAVKNLYGQRSVRCTFPCPPDSGPRDSPGLRMQHGTAVKVRRDSKKAVLIQYPLPSSSTLDCCWAWNVAGR